MGNRKHDSDLLTLEQALLNAKNTEEIVQENDLESRDAQESLTCLETCKESERSGLEFEFWQDFKERLESGRGAPLNVDCVFNELSRNLLVPKEVR